LREVRELKGYKALRALNGFNALLLGLKMLPSYQAESYEDFFDKVQAMPEDAQEKILREACLFVQLQPDEIEAMVSFCSDANGVPYCAENIKNLSPSDFVEVIVAVSMTIAKMNVGLVSESEKKKSQISASI
jgi:hypothetical protein